MPTIFEVDPPSIQGDDPVILTSLLLRNDEVHFLPGGKKFPSRKHRMANFTLHPAFGGYGILKAVADSEPKDHYKTLWAKSAEVPMWIGSCDYEQPFDDILGAFALTLFGGARVTKGRLEALITLGDAVGLIREGELSTRMSTDEVGSVPIAISKDRPIIEAIRMMVLQGVRRLFIEKRRGAYISDRSVIDYMFSPERLGVAKDHPELWVDEPVERVGTKTAGRCSSGNLDDAAKEMGSAPDDCLITDGLRVISRWDIVVKPWKAGRLEAVES